MSYLDNLCPNFPHLHHFLYLCDTYSDDPYIHMSERWCYCDLTEKGYYCTCRYCKTRHSIWEMMNSAKKAEERK